MQIDRLTSAPLGFFGRRALQKAAEGLGEHCIDKLVDAGVTIQVDDPYSETGRSLRAQYLPSKKTVQLGESRLSADTIRHELGHAIDDLAAPDTDKPQLASYSDEKLHGLYDNYCDQVEQASWWDKHLGDAMWSDYATTNPQEYLAEGIMLYTGSDRERRKLEKSDPGLFQYVGDFLIR